MPVAMDEWELYQPLTGYWEDRGYQTASQVTDPKGSRWEVDVAAFTPEVTDVRITEVKLEPSESFVAQCLDRLEMAPRVYAALPRDQATTFAEQTLEDQGRVLGVLGVDDDGVHLVREAHPTEEPRREGRAQVFERVLRGELT